MDILTLASELSVDRLASGRPYNCIVEPTADEVADLAERFDFIAIESMRAEVIVRKVAKDCWDLSGRLTAKVTQRCVLTGEPVPELVDFTLEERYVRDADSDGEVEVTLEGAEPLVGGAIDVGEMVAQSLGVAVTPWPRTESMVESHFTEDRRDDHPFAGLAALKKPD